MKDTVQLIGVAITIVVTIVIGFIIAALLTYSLIYSDTKVYTVPILVLITIYILRITIIDNTKAH